MKKFIIYFGSLFFIAGLSSGIQGQTQVRLDDEIERFNDDTDHTMKCQFALNAFRSEFEKDPANPVAALYLARGYDKIASISGECEITDSIFFRYSDSALKYFHLAEKLQPGIRERKFGFTVPVMIGHLFGTLCLWHLKHGEYAKAQQAMIDGRNAGGFMDAQIEYCRLMLDFCDTNAIFFPLGDDDTFPTMYLQMVEGYRTDVSVINASLANMPWYAKLFLQKGHKGFTPVEITMTSYEIDSLENTNSQSVAQVPDRLYTDVHPSVRARIHKELGIDVADKAEICFPVYQEYEGKGYYYTLGFDKFIASILQANQWRRRIFFGIGLESTLHCTHVAVRNGGIIDELYPINLGQVGHFKKNDKWYHEEKMKKIFLRDINMEKFTNAQQCSIGEVGIYYGLVEYLYSLDSTDKSAKQVIRNIQSIPHDCLKGSEGTVFACSRVMYDKGFKEEAKKECEGVLPWLEKNLSISKVSWDGNDSQYIIALIISGRCSEAKEFINSFDISAQTKTDYLGQISVAFGCD